MSAMLYCLVSLSASIPADIGSITREDIVDLLDSYSAPAEDPVDHFDTVCGSLLDSLDEPVTLTIDGHVVQLERVGAQLVVTATTGGVPVSASLGMDEYGRLTLGTDETSILGDLWIDVRDDVAILGLQNSSHRILMGASLLNEGIVGVDASSSYCACYGANETRPVLRCDPPDCALSNPKTCQVDGPAHHVCTSRSYEYDPGGICGRGVLVAPTAILSMLGGCVLRRSRRGKARFKDRL